MHAQMTTKEKTMEKKKEAIGASPAPATTSATAVAPVGTTATETKSSDDTKIVKVAPTIATSATGCDDELKLTINTACKYAIHVAYSQDYRRTALIGLMLPTPFVVAFGRLRQLTESHGDPHEVFNDKVLEHALEYTYALLFCAMPVNSAPTATEDRVRVAHSIKAGLKDLRNAWSQGKTVTVVTKKGWRDLFYDTRKVCGALCQLVSQANPTAKSLTDAESQCNALVSRGVYDGITSLMPPSEELQSTLERYKNHTNPNARKLYDCLDYELAQEATKHKIVSSDHKIINSSPDSKQLPTTLKAAYDDAMALLTAFRAFNSAMSVFENGDHCFVKSDSVPTVTQMSDAMTARYKWCTVVCTYVALQSKWSCLDWRLEAAWRSAVLVTPVTK